MSRDDCDLCDAAAGKREAEIKARYAALVAAAENVIKNPYPGYELIALDKLHKALAAVKEKK